MGSKNNIEKINFVDLGLMPTLETILKLAHEHAPGSNDVEALQKYITHYKIVVSRTKSPELTYRIKMAEQMIKIIEYKNQQFTNALLQTN